MINAIAFIGGILLAVVVQSQAQALTCADVLALSSAQREMYARQFGVTAAQRAQIKRECGLGDGRSIRKAKRT